MIKKAFILLLTLQIIICNVSIAQSKRGKVWVNGSGVSFKVNFEPTGIVNTYLDTAYSPYFHMGNSNICDTTGNLILCSDGYNIYDSNANYIDEGDTLIPQDFYIHEDGWSLYSQSSIFLPMDSDKYYFVTPTFSDAKFADCLANNNCHFDLLLYNIIDMKANAGAGKVVKRMQPLMENAQLSKTQMIACRHSNGKDWWLLKQGGDSNKVYKFLFQQDTVIDFGSQTFNSPAWNTNWDLRGQSMFNQKGSKYASTVDGIPATGEIFLADFDRCYGILGNQKIIYTPEMSIHNPNDSTQKQKTSVGLAFSPNGQLLYVMSPYNLWQYDMSDETWYHVAGLDTTYLYFQQYNASYLGPDDKLYIGNFGGQMKQMSVVNNPDVKGTGCNFCPRCLRLDSVFWAGGVTTPPCMPNYSLGAQVCWPLGNSEMESLDDKLSVYPNPAITLLYIKTESKDKKELYNSVGQLLFSTKENEINVNNFSKGVYYLKVGNAVKKIIIE